MENKKVNLPLAINLLLLLILSCETKNSHCISNKKVFAGMNEDVLMDYKYQDSLLYIIKEIQGIGLSNQCSKINDKQYNFLNEKLDEKNLIRLKGNVRLENNIVWYLNKNETESVLFSFYDTIHQVHKVYYDADTNNCDILTYNGKFRDFQTNDTFYCYNIHNHLICQNNPRHSKLTEYDLYFSKRDGIVAINFCKEFNVDIRVKPKFEIGIGKVLIPDSLIWGENFGY